jgi:hypothetical protein
MGLGSGVMIPCSRLNGRAACQSAPGIWVGILLALVVVASAQAADEAVLRSVRDVQGLSSTQAAKQIPVEIRGVVTYYEKKWDALFVQDETGGSYIYPGATARPELKAGQAVTVMGRTRAGGGPRAASAIQEDRIAVEAGRSEPIPEPLRLSYNDLAAGRADGQWIEVEGVVRVLWAERERFEIDLAMDGGRVRMHLPRSLGVPLPRGLLHSRGAGAGCLRTGPGRSRGGARRPCVHACHRVHRVAGTGDRTRETPDPDFHRPDDVEPVAGQSAPARGWRGR